MATAANISDVAMLPDLLPGEETRVWGDGAYQGQTEVIRVRAPRRNGFRPSTKNITPSKTRTISDAIFIFSLAGNQQLCVADLLVTVSSNEAQHFLI